MPYLTEAEFIERFGNAEAVRLTDEAHTGTVDAAKLDAALADASETADTYLAVRYGVPLATAPAAVKQIVADLTRERLYKDRPTPQVTANADRARSMLRDFAAGRATLLLGDVVADEIATQAPVVGSAGYGPTFTREAMDRFTG